MKNKFIIIVIFIIVTGCSAYNWQSYAVKEPNGRLYLKQMKFKESFETDMGDCIDEGVIYILEQEPGKNVPRYIILRFFDTGQWIRFTSNEYPTSDLINDMTMGKFIGYYNCKKDILLTEEPNFNFSNSGVRNIHNFKIYDSYIEQLNSPFKSKPIYKKCKIDGMQPISPDW